MVERPSRLARLRFDGRQLTAVDAHGRVLKAWPAISGALTHLSPKNQPVRDKGPIPEGAYVAGRADLQHIKDRPTSRVIAGVVGLGTWPGGQGSWGKHRLWLKPDAGNGALGRDNFSIHGGSVPGSAGCIDLVGGSDDFTKFF